MNESAPVSFAEATRTWIRVGLLSFGGPAGQIAVMHRILVEEKRWISEPRFLHALNYCMLLPGPEAQQLATYIGWLLHGTRGGLVAGSLFVLPGFMAILALSLAYVLWQNHPLLLGVLSGLKAAVIALVIEALLRISRRALQTRAAQLVAVVAFVAITLARVPFPLVVLGAGTFGFLLAHRGRDWFPAAPALESDSAASPRAVPTRGRAWRLLALWLPLWFAPVALAAVLAGAGHVFTQLGLFFSQMAVVSFGGAYAVLAYVAQQAVRDFGWITSAQMIDGLGLAESTPGPLIMVVQFVGFLAAYQAAGAESPLLDGVIAAAITVWVTFVPCFLWIFLGAPYVETLRNHRAISGALRAITAAVVGVIASLALWFVTQVLFARVDSWGVPEFSSWQPVSVALTVVALLLLFALRTSLGLTLTITTLLGAATTFLPL
jgi:chromate transporter